MKILVSHRSASHLTILQLSTSICESISANTIVINLYTGILDSIINADYTGYIPWQSLPAVYHGRIFATEITEIHPVSFKVLDPIALLDTKGIFHISVEVLPLWSEVRTSTRLCSRPATNHIFLPFPPFPWTSFRCLSDYGASGKNKVWDSKCRDFGDSIPLLLTTYGIVYAAN